MLRHLLTDKQNPLNWYERFKVRTGKAEGTGLAQDPVLDRYKTSENRMTQMVKTKHHENSILHLAKQDDLDYLKEKHLFRHIPMDKKMVKQIRKAGPTDASQTAMVDAGLGEGPPPVIEFTVEGSPELSHQRGEGKQPDESKQAHEESKQAPKEETKGGEESDSEHEGQALDSNSSSSADPPKARSPEYYAKSALETTTAIGILGVKVEARQHSGPVHKYVLLHGETAINDIQDKTVLHELDAQLKESAGHAKSFTKKRIDKFRKDIAEQLAKL